MVSNVKSVFNLLILTITWCFLVEQLSQLERDLEKGGSIMDARESWENAQTNGVGQEWDSATCSQM